MPAAASVSFPVGGSGQLSLRIEGDLLTAHYTGPSSYAIYLALRTGAGSGSCIVPFAQGLEGSTVFLPFPADRLYMFADNQRFCRIFTNLSWSGRSADCPEFASEEICEKLVLRIVLPATRDKYCCSVAAYVKDLEQNFGWGSLMGCCDSSTALGPGDKVLSAFYEFTGLGKTQPVLRQRFHRESRERIYELFVRLFGNTNEQRTRNGTLLDNGCGKFCDITAPALAQIAAMGFTHVWLMGIVRHASTTAYPLPGLEADRTDLMKGLAGSPYAIKDYFDVAPDLAVEPARRVDEFQELTGRVHAAGLKVLIDFVGNHVSRAYHSQVRPDMNFGSSDSHHDFFKPDNNFFYLESRDAGGGPPLLLPTFDRQTQTPVSATCKVKNDCDGLFEGETSFGRVTGNNSITWTPSMNDWYETVKLNYGFDFARRSEQLRNYPHAASPSLAIPNTWGKVDAVLEFWQQLGVDGFRCDMAHMLPPEFWQWSIGRARRRDPAVFFMAEAYQDALVVASAAPEVNALAEQPLFPGLLHAGFNAVYGHGAYRVIKGLYDGSNWANDIDSVSGSDFVFGNSVHYAENHDEVRLASPYSWAGAGARVGIPVSAVLFGLSRGPVLFYNGQEVGEPALEPEGFSGADGRTSIFDYWSMPELFKWVSKGAYDGGQLSFEQHELRAYYGRLVRLCGEPAFADGQYFGLNDGNRLNAAYGRLEEEAVSGHWLYSFLRFDPSSRQRFLVIANFHESQALQRVRVRIPEPAWTFLQCRSHSALRFTERLHGGAVQAEFDHPQSELAIPNLPALTACYFQLEEQIG